MLMYEGVAIVSLFLFSPDINCENGHTFPMSRSHNKSEYLGYFIWTETLQFEISLFPTQTF